MDLHTAFIALGSNQGDSIVVIRSAARLLEPLSRRPLLRSSLWESKPVDCPPGSTNFVNAVVSMEPHPGETPESLLAQLQALEVRFGRQPKKILNEPRPLDLDLIAFGTATRTTPFLTLPHPRAHLRRFVLEPLNELAPNFVLPGQSLRVSELLDALVLIEPLRRLGPFEQGLDGDACRLFNPAAE